MIRAEGVYHPPSPSHFKTLTVGVWNDKLTYKIKYNPENPLEAIASVTDAHGKHKIPKERVHWTNIDTIPLETLRYYAANAKSRFTVEFKGETNFSIHITLNDYNPISLAPNRVPKPFPLVRSDLKPVQPLARTANKPLTFFSITNASELATAYQQNLDPLHEEIIHRMVERFCTLSIIVEEAVQEIVIISSCCTEEDKRRVLEKIVSSLLQSPFFRGFLMDGLIGILMALLRGRQLKAKTPQRTSEIWGSKYIVQIIEVLVAHLAKHPLGAEALSVITNLMTILDLIWSINEPEPQQFDSCKKSLASIKDIQINEPFIVFLKEYAIHLNVKNSILLEPPRFLSLNLDRVNDQSDSIKIYFHRDSFNINDINIIYNEFKNKFNDSIILSNNWFVYIIILRQIFINKPKKLSIFKESINKPEMKNILPISHEYFFVLGLLLLLKQIADMCRTARQPEIVKVAIDIIEEIKMQNNEFNASSDKGLFKVKRSKIVRDLCFKLLEFYPNHSMSITSNKDSAKGDNTQKNSSQQKIRLEPNLLRPIGARADSNEPSSSSLFDYARDAAAPWAQSIFSHLRQLYNEVNFEQEIIERFIAKDSKGTKGSVVMMLDQAINTTDSKVILLLVPAGFEKSHFSKKYVLNKLEAYTSTKHLFLYISLLSIKEPRTHLMEESLGMLHLLNESNELKKRKICIFCDSYDLKFPREGRAHLDNLYSSNKLSTVWPNVQLIFICDATFLDLSTDSVYFWPEQGKLEVLEMQPYQNIDTPFDVSPDLP